jgi:hypothetical protein
MEEERSATYVKPYLWAPRFIVVGEECHICRAW